MARDVRVERVTGSNAPPDAADEVDDEEDHKERQQNVNRRHSYVEGEEADEPCDQEQYRDCQPHIKHLSRASAVRAPLFSRMAGAGQGLLPDAPG